MPSIQRRAYAEMFGPTTGDRVRLADTDLVIEVERDFTVYGEEVKFGGGKTIRDGMGQSQCVNGPGAGDAVDSLTLDRAVELLAERRAKGPSKPRRRGRK